MTDGNDTARAAERMLNLLALLTWSTQPMTLDQIGEKMGDQYGPPGEGRRTLFERDKRALRRIGVPITTITLGGHTAGVGAYFVDSKSDRYGNLYASLTKDELAILQTAAAMVQMDQPWGKRALARLGGHLPEAEVPAGANLPSATETLATLWSALRERRPAMFDYHGRTRTVHPYGLLSRNGFWYLAGWDSHRNETVAFRVDRIESEVRLGAEGAFERPEDFKVADAIAPDSKRFGDTGETCTVRIDASLAPTVVAELGEQAVVARHAGGSVDVLAPCGNRFGFRSWLFAMVDRAEVIAPPEMRVEVVGWLSELADAGKGA
jgi:predicted DNA-binding transcriptional regulator YafY